MLQNAMTVNATNTDCITFVVLPFLGLVFVFISRDHTLLLNTRQTFGSNGLYPKKTDKKETGSQVRRRVGGKQNPERLDRLFSLSVSLKTERSVMGLLFRNQEVKRLACRDLIG